MINVTHLLALFLGLIIGMIAGSIYGWLAKGEVNDRKQR
jgi:hypothetical protein